MLLRMRKITKTFFDTEVVKNVGFELKSGEIFGIVGLNGAGKSTFIKIISGVHPCDSGKIFIENESVKLNSPNDAYKHGIFTIYQEPLLVNNMSVMNNIFLGMFKKRAGIFVDKKAVQQTAANLLKLLGSSLSPNDRVSTLSLGEKYLVSIARAFLAKAKIFIFDEPSVGLSLYEKQVLFDLIRRLKEKGAGVIYITHYIDEIIELCDKVMILREGRNVCTSDVKLLTQEKIITIMSGKSVKKLDTAPKSITNTAALEISGLSRKSIYKDISFKLYPGEILGIAGSVGAGRTALLKTIFGHMQPDKGKIYVHGELAEFARPLDAIRKGIGYIPDDRVCEGVLSNMSVLENSAFPKILQNKQILIDYNTLIDKTLDIVIELDIKLDSVRQSVNYLSGGNQQKLVLSRWMLSNADILLLDEPTKGIDISARNDIYCWMSNKAQSGSAIIISSSDFAELKMLCTRIIVLNKGRITAEMDNAEATENKMLRAMAHSSSET